MFRKLTIRVSLAALVAVPAFALGAQQRDSMGYLPMSLADAIKLAKENNVLTISGVNSVRNTQLNIRSNRAELYPSVTATTSQSKGAGQRIGPQGTLIDYNASWTYSTQIAVNQTLFDGGKAFADVRKARADVATQEATLTATEYNLAFNVKTDYNSILAAKEAEAAAQAQLVAAQQQLDFSIAKVNAGAANVSDSLNNVVAVGNAQIAILTAQQNLRASVAALTHLVGTPYPVTAVYADTVEIPKLNVDSASLVKMALDGPTVRAAQATYNSGQALIRSQKAAWMPTVSLTGTYGGSGAASEYGFNSQPYPYSRNIGINLNYPIFNRFNRENGIASAQIGVETDQANIKDAQLNAIQTIVTQLGLLQNAEAQIRVDQISIQAAKEGLRVNQQRYNLGAGTLLDVLNSQSTLITAQQQLIQARLNYRNARAAIEAVIGRDIP